MPSPAKRARPDDRDYIVEMLRPGRTHDRRRHEGLEPFVASQESMPPSIAFSTIPFSTEDGSMAGWSMAGRLPFSPSVHA